VSKTFRLPHAGTLQRLNRTPQPPNVAVLGSTVSSKLTLNGFVKYLTLRLTGSLTVGVAAATVFSEAPLGLLRRIDFKTSDNTVLMSFTGELLHRLGNFIRHKASERVAPATGVGTNAFSSTLFLDHEALSMLDPSESLHDPTRWNDVFVDVTWGQATDIATAGGGGTIAIAAGAQLAITVHQVMEGIDQIEYDHIHSFVEIPITASNTRLETDVPGIGSLGGVLLQTRRDAGAGAGPVPVDDLINDVTFEAGGTSFHVNRLPWAELQRDNVSDFQLDGAAVLGNQIPGYAYLRLDDNRQLASLYNIRGMNKPKLVLNVTRTSGTEVVRLLWDFYRLHPEAFRRMSGAA
jgi:hypothetical protein